MKLLILLSTLLFIMFGCSDPGASGKSSPTEILDDGGAKTVPQVEISGLVYFRDPAVSYSLQLNNTQALKCDLAAINDINTTCNDAGAYTLVVPAPDYTPIKVTKSAYIPMDYTVWGETNQSVSIGLYTAPTVTPKTDFMKGMVYLDLGNTYPFTFWEKIIDEPKSQINAQLVSYVYNGFNYSCNTTDHNVSISTFHPTYPDWRMPTKAELAPLVAKVHAAGMQFNLWLDLVDVNECGNGAMYSWDQSDTTFWDHWFQSYETLMTERAQVAKDLGIEWITLGHNFGYASAQPATRWQTVINKIKTIYPGVKLTYFGGVNLAESPVYFESDAYNEGTPNDFASLLDTIGYAVVTVVKTSNPSRQEIKAGFRAIESNASSFSVPIWILPMTPSTTVGASDATFIEPELLSDNIGLSYDTDFYQQADVYQALFEVINESPGGNGHIMGVLPWGYHLQNNYRDSGPESNSNPNIGNLILDRTANIRGKPAESVVRWWYQKL